MAMSQTAMGLINTAYIERLNATFRARMPSLVRRTRNLARTLALQAALKTTPRCPVVLPSDQ